MQLVTNTGWRIAAALALVSACGEPEADTTDDRTTVSRAATDPLASADSASRIYHAARYTGAA